MLVFIFLCYNKCGDNMKIEKRCLIHSMINNLLISIIKVGGGIIFSLSSLFADGMHTFVDFITDIFALIGAKISKKRPTKIHPFGFGRIEYLTNLLIGMVIIFLGIFILISSFMKKPVIPPLIVIVLLLVVSIMKFVMIRVLVKNGEKINSGILLTAAKESTTDLYSTIVVIIVVLVMQLSSTFEFLEYADLVGSIFLSLLVIKTGIPIIKQNVMNLIGEADIDKEHLKYIEDVLKEFKVIRDHKTQLIKYGSYYKVYLELELDPSTTLRQMYHLREKIVSELKNDKVVKIRYVNLDFKPED